MLMMAQRSRAFYYGWVIVWMAGLSMVATLPGRTVGLGLITEPLIADLGLTRSGFARQNMIATLVGSVFAVIAGRLTDRLGIRVMLSAVLVMLGVLIVGMSRWAGSGSIVAFLILTRGFGQSALSTVSVTSVGKWFTRRLAAAMGVFSLIVALGFVLAIVLCQAQIEVHGWRNVWWALGGSIFVLGCLSLGLTRDRPGNGDTEVTSESDEGKRSLSLTEALQAPCFWIFGIGMALYGGVLAAVSLFNESILMELGFGADTFRYAMAGLMVGGLVGNVFAALAARYFSLPRIMAVSLAVLALVLVTYPKLAESWQVIAHGSIYGFCGGVFSVLFFTGFGQAFGRLHLGKIQGCAQVLAVFASALGPWWLVGWQAGSECQLFSIAGCTGAGVCDSGGGGVVHATAFARKWRVDRIQQRKFFGGKSSQSKLIE